MKLLTSVTPMALWHEIIHDAEATCAITLKQELESYLVLLLMRHIQHPEIAKKIIATELLQAIQTTSTKRQLILQEVGDTCLIFSGLFPKMAEKRLVKISYFVNIGRSAYAHISRKNNDLYSLLAEQFVPLMDVLQSIRQYTQDIPDLLPFQAYDLWNETGSKRAFSALKQYTQGVPIRLSNKR
jgi:hypothetical protein